MFDGIELKELMGAGAFGSVYRGVKDNKNYAVKKVTKALLIDEQKKMYFNNEIYILKRLKHQNVAEFYGMKEALSCFYLYMEYCNGETLLGALEHYMKKNNKPFSEEIVRYLAKQILEGVAYVHRKQVIHRDIKADNILLTYANEEDKAKKNILNSTVKIIDFGFARYLNKYEKATTIIGTPLYMDPKILGIGENEASYNEKCDIWSLGILIYHLLIGVQPFQGNNIEELCQNIKSFKCTIPNEICLSNECVSFINKLLTIDEAQRPSAKTLLTDPFILGEYNINSCMSLKNTDKKESEKHCFNDYWQNNNQIPETTQSTQGDKPQDSRIIKSPEKKTHNFALTNEEKEAQSYKQTKTMAGPSFNYQEKTNKNSKKQKPAESDCLIF